MASEVVLGGRKVAVRRPRVRPATGEVSLPTFERVADTDPLDRRVVEQMPVGVATRDQVEAWRHRALGDLDVVALLIDGVEVAGRCVVVAPGIDATGSQHALGLRTDRSLLVIVDGSKALPKAVTQVFEVAAWMQRCQAHETRNILAHLPERDRPWVRAQLRRAYRDADPEVARRVLLALAGRLEATRPGAEEA